MPRKTSIAKRVMVSLSIPVLDFLQNGTNHGRAGLSLADNIRYLITSHPTFDAYHREKFKAETRPITRAAERAVRSLSDAAADSHVAQARRDALRDTTTTVVADTPPAEPVDVQGYLRRTARYREPTLQETMAELDRVSDAGTPIGQYRVSDVKPRPPCEHGVPSDSFCEACADLELARERMGDGT